MATCQINWKLYQTVCKARIRWHAYRNSLWYRNSSAAGQPLTERHDTERVLMGNENFPFCCIICFHVLPFDVLSSIGKFVRNVAKIQDFDSNSQAINIIWRSALARSMNAS